MTHSRPTLQALSQRVSPRASAVVLVASLVVSLAAPLGAAPPLAQSGGERALLVVDPSHDDSLHIANVYAAARSLPDRNVLFLDPDAPDYAALVAGPLQGVLGEIEQRARGASVDFLVLAPSDQYRVSASGLITDGCSPVNHFGLASAYGMYDYAEAILGSGQLMAAAITNQYVASGWLPRSFRGADFWRNGGVSDPSVNGARRMLIPTRLGWTGERGNTPQEVIDMIVRSVAVDGTEPVGTVYYMQTTDPARSAPRHGLYPLAVTKMAEAGGSGEHLFEVLPTGRNDVLGIMTGAATPAIDTAPFTLLDGAFCDHLTSFAGHFGTSSQTKMSRWIARGASGTSGAIEEPCNYAAKFPHPRIHTAYRRGATLGESWLRSRQAIPLQSMFLGDPLTQPWSAGPTVDVPGAPTGPVSGVVTLTPVGTPNAASGTPIAAYELLLDGVLVQRIDAGDSFSLDTAGLAAGPHGLLVRAEDDSPARFVGVWAGGLEVLGGVSVALSATTTSGDLGTTFSIDVAAAGADVEEVVIRHLGRVVAASTDGSVSLPLVGRVLGAGPARLVAEATFAGGERAVSAPLLLDIAPVAGAPALVAPRAFSYRRELTSTAPFVLDLPATFADPLSGATYEVVLAPTRSTVLWSQGSSLVLAPDAGARGVDLLQFRVTTPSGASTPATVQIVYADGAEDVSVFCRALPNEAGDGARLGWSGTTSLTADDLVLSAAGLPTQSFAIAFRGQGFGQVPVGNGSLCVIGGQVRLAVVQADLAGGLAWPVVQSSQPGTQATAGSTWGFQLWFRDSILAGSGFSDGLSVTFLP